ncbi:MAG: DNA translocase FtsK 4TM domain-containing protein [Coriobacteriales bacterium]|nr:DNA translocase FtsK 4TM domain-containing protein [Coriobacteriales bacterium]
MNTKQRTASKPAARATARSTAHSAQLSAQRSPQSKAKPRATSARAGASTAKKTTAKKSTATKARTASNNKARSGQASKPRGGAASSPRSNSRGGARSSTPAKNQRKAAVVPEEELIPKTPLLSETVKNDVIGLAITVIGIVLLVVILAPGEAIVARVLSDTVHLFIGLGTFLLPFIVILWGLTFFIKKRLTYAPLRFVLGLSLIFLGVISLLGSSTPGAAADPEAILQPDAAMSQGGYLGGALAWAGLSSIGLIPTNIIFVALIIAGAMLIGFSITGLIERIVAFIKTRQEENVVELPSFQGAYMLGPNGTDPNAAAFMNPTRLRKTPYATENLYDEALYEESYLDGPQGKLPLSATADLGSTRRLSASQGASVLTPTGVNRGRLSVESLDFEDGANTGREGREVRGEASGTTSRSARNSKGSAKTSTRGANGSAGKIAAASASASSASALLDNFKLPDERILRVSREKATTKAGISELKTTAARLQATLEEFGVDGEVIGWIAGPTVTLYKISLGEGVRLNRVTNLQDDIQLALAALAVRIVAPIPGTSLVGIEVPNDTRNTVLLGDVLPASQPGPLQLAIGKDVEGDAITADLTTMPHLLIGGTTGSGKSVAINSIIMSVLMRATPRDVRMILIDPKRVELSLYNGIPHLYVPVITDPAQAASALAWAVLEMERRLKVFEKHAVKNIRQFNVKVTAELERRAAEEAKAAAKAAEAAVSPSASSELDELDEFGEPMSSSQQADGSENPASASAAATAAAEQKSEAVLQEELAATMPYIVIVIDELADLMMVAGKEVEASISRLAQLARAAGLHLIVATQRPSTNVITGLIKANIVNRIAFTVASGIDSRVILDTPGAEDLIGLGDLLFGRPEYSKPMRIQGCFVSEPEIETAVEFLRSQGEPDYHEDILFTSSPGLSAAGIGTNGDAGDDDPLMWEAADIVVSSGLGSTSTLQRRLKVGYARAGRIMDMLEMKGIVGPPNGSKPREVLIDDVLDLETLKAFESA